MLCNGLSLSTDLYTVSFTYPNWFWPKASTAAGAICFVIVYQEQDVLEWLPADMIYQRMECVITMLKWVLNDPKYKYINCTNVLDIIEGYY